MTRTNKENRQMKQRLSTLAIVFALIGSFMTMHAAPALAQGGSNPNTNRLEVPITGVVQNVGNVTGTFKISRFAIQDGTLVAIGQLNGTYTDATGVARTIVSQVAWPVENAGSGSPGAEAASCDAGSATRDCDILNLVLGPLHLDLLGLVIDLNRVVLNITGTTGAGDLLGNLLCAITGLLDAGALGQQVVNLLNQLVGVLAGL
jgi:hypothetical protein